MGYQRNVNTPYSNLGKFAFSPISWAFETESRGDYPMPDFGKLICAAIAWPVLVPATFVTSAIAISLAVIPALLHLLSLAVAATADVCLKPDYESVSTPTLA